MKSFKNNQFVKIIFVLSLMASSTALANTATPASFFNETYLKMQINDGLTPNLEVRSITFQRSEGKTLDQFQAAVHQDIDDQLRKRAKELNLPKYMQDFLNQKMEEFDSYGFLVRNCVLRKDDCGKDLFHIIVETKPGQGMNGIQYQCDTELIIQEPHSGVFRSHEGDIKLKIDNCKLINADVTKNHLLISSGLQRPSLATLSRSGYDTDKPLEISLNSQVDFLVQVENFTSHQRVVRQEAPLTDIDVTREEVVEFEEVTVIEREPRHSSEFSSDNIIEMMGGGSNFEPTKPELKNTAKYCEVFDGGIQYSCFNERNPAPVGAPCTCDFPRGVQGTARL